ncbi:MAG: FkbM family methyltransferase [Candidatus Omnitrophota bacterium]|jgi:FkbM family methyltransferase
MCAKFNKVVYNLIPPGPVRDTLKGAYFSLYYNLKHFKENDFRVYYKKGCYTYAFEEGVSFKCYENITDDLKRSLRGYLAQYTPKTGDVIMDCGAYVGDFTLYAAKAVGKTGKVVAYEPDPTAFKRLCENINLNALNNVILVNKGVWSDDTALEFSGGDKGANFFNQNTHNKTFHKVSVVSIDSEAQRLGLNKIDFIKMDVEGAEIEAVKGAAKTLKENNVRLALASYHEVNGEKTCHELEKLLSAIGYRSETSHKRHLTTYAQKAF